MIVPCCTAYDMLLVCRMSLQDIVGLIWVTGGKGSKAAPREKWITSFFKRQVIAFPFFLDGFYADALTQLSRHFCWDFSWPF